MIDSEAAGDPQALTVLVVDDDPAIVRTLSITLRARGYVVRTAGDGRTALEMITEDPPDVVLLDLGLPDIDGVAVLRQVRSVSAVPVVVVSARHESEDKVEALDLGADDYVTKPFGVEELLARVRAAVRHARPAAATRNRVIETETFRLDLTDHRATRHGEPVHLTPTEWQVVEVLTRRPGALVRQRDLLHQVWGPAYGSETNYLRVYLAQLRRKLEPEPSRPRHFITEPGVGHRFVA